MTQRKGLWHNDEGYAVVEATILFPIIMMVFAGLVLLSMYLPTRAVLQQETQYAATAMATTQSDTWLDYDSAQMKYYWKDSLSKEDNVYAVMIASFCKGNSGEKAKTIVKKLDEGNIVAHVGELRVECEVNNFVVYKEIVVTATRTIPIPGNLSLINFPEEIPITVSSTAVVQNGDEFVRNIDLAADFLEYLNKKLFNGNQDGPSICQKFKGWVESAWKFLGVSRGS